MAYLVDTNVFCEPLRPRPDPAVTEWLREHRADLRLSVITIAEIRRGIERLPKGTKRDHLGEWLSQVCQRMGGNILSVNRSVAHVWGQMQGQLDQEGITLPAFDGLIAATAVRHSLTIVTRNERDFAQSPAPVLNPFSSD